MIYVPDGWQLTLKSPTRDMVRAMCSVTCRECHMDCQRGPYQQMYKEALAECPPPPDFPQDHKMPEKFTGMRRAVRIGYQVSTAEVKVLLEAHDAMAIELQNLKAIMGRP